MTKYLNEFHKMNTEKKLKEIQEFKKHPVSAEEASKLHFEMHKNMTKNPALSRALDQFVIRQCKKYNLWPDDVLLQMIEFKTMIWPSMKDKSMGLPKATENYLEDLYGKKER